jgi:DNA invertase Pin-like site-specific DNA recombinase
MARFLMQMMGAVAEFERSLIREWQTEGIQKTQERSVKFGGKRY